jgi:trimethylamine:corrinoid methyltransferase-like protein
VRQLQWRPTIINRATQKNWEADGSPDLTEKANRRVRDIMANHTPEPLAPELKAKMDAMVDAYVAAGK